MYQSFEHFKASTQKNYNALRANPSMKLSDYRQHVAVEMGYNNPQSLKNALESIDSAHPKEFVADEIADLFSTSQIFSDVDNACCSCHIVDEMLYISHCNGEVGEENLAIPVDSAKAELFGAKLTLLSEGNFVASYIVYVLHSQPKITQEAILVNMDCGDSALYLNGVQLVVADPDFDCVDTVTKAAFNLRAAMLNTRVVVVDYSSRLAGSEDWTWDEVMKDISLPVNKRSTGVVGVRELKLELEKL
jgi:hypothetical protein